LTESKKNSPKCEVGGVVTWTTSGRTFSNMARWSVNHAGMPYLSAAASAVAGERSQIAARSPPGGVFRQAGAAERSAQLR
jgi:hypothetical protein